MKRVTLSYCWTGIAVTVLAFGGAVAAETQSARPGVVNVDIRSQPIGAALNELARQAGIQLLLFTDVASDLKQPAPALAGTFATEEALLKLLANTGLTFSYVNERTVAVHRVANTVSRDITPRAEALPPVIRLANDLKVADAGNSEIMEETGTPVVARENSREEPRNRRIEEVIVSAQKREERAFDVPISMVAVGTDELQKRKITSMDDLSMAVPGLAVQSAGAWTRRIAVRGISNVYGTSSLIGLYLDEASATSSADLQLDLRAYDLDRVEVLRGPQGTLYGEGSVGGTIRFITKNPQLHGFLMNGNVAVSSTQDGSPSQRIEGVVNIPVIDNTLGLRVAGTFDHTGGWLDQPGADKKDFNDQNVANVRVKGLWQPAPHFTVNGMAVVHRNDGSTNTGEDVNGNYTQTFSLTSTPSVQDDYELYNLTLTYDFPAARLLSTSTYLDQDREQENYGYRLFGAGPVRPLIPDDVHKPFYSRKARVSTEELRLSSIDAGPWMWTLGGFYRYARFNNDNRFHFGRPGAPGAPLPALIYSEDDNLSKSWAVFGDTSYRIADRLTLGAGLRHFHDDQEYANGTGVNAPAVLGAKQIKSFQTLNPRVYAHYKLTDEVNTYISAAKGFRSGGFNRVATRPPFGPENVWTYELGSKISVLQGRLASEVAVFYSDYKNYQINGFLPPPALPINLTSNAGNARIKGVEMGFNWRPVEDWTLSFNGEYVNTEFVKITLNNANYVVGDPLDLFPKYSYTISTQHDFRLGGKTGFARLDYNERGRQTERARATGPWYLSESDVINMLNFNASLEWNESFSLGVFAQNLLNDRGFIDPFAIEELAARSRPRTFGIQFDVNFE